MKVKLIYVFNDWFKKEKYDYLRMNMEKDGVDYYYNELPPHAIGLDENKFDIIVEHREDTITLW